MWTTILYQSCKCKMRTTKKNIHNKKISEGSSACEIESAPNLRDFNKIGSEFKKNSQEFTSNFLVRGRSGGNSIVAS
ncbi:hypothetical protein SERLA73DRAFT_182449 [Serpula lacrymans var. lacrymans S7.3]|uniref:Uncharacterized protein n=1 Tax=Serpula lacrymans var. lacrymans (strain S7.3) TaxID=936435 RepID=F8PXG0_SERL3|nr:hypothetical protein SERLA73DRAFT_182449 [Serpula lacrymans var. lacrymans S7.3]